MNNQTDTNQSFVENQDLKYFNSIHRSGRIATIITIILMMIVPLACQIYAGVTIDLKHLGVALISVGAMFVPLSIVEVFSYAPYLGAGGTYLAFITGNIGAMKLPATIASVNQMDKKFGSKEADVIALLATAASSIVTTVIVFVGMLFISQMLPLLQSPVLKPAFDNMRPALIGAFGIPFIIKSFKAALPPILVAFIAVLVMGLATFNFYSTYLMPVFMAIAAAFSYAMFKKGMLK